MYAMTFVHCFYVMSVICVRNAFYLCMLCMYGLRVCMLCFACLYVIYVCMFRRFLCVCMCVWMEGVYVCMYVFARYV